MSNANSRWRNDGVRIVRAGELDSKTAQTPGMQRRAAVTTASTGAKQLWAGTVTIEDVASIVAVPVSGVATIAASGLTVFVPFSSVQVSITGSNPVFRSRETGP